MRSYIWATIIGLAFVIGMAVMAGAYKYKFKTTDRISVTGGAEKDFVSDQIVWSASYTRRSMDLKEAYALLKADEAMLRSYLERKSVSAGEIVFSAVNISKDYNTTDLGDGRSQTVFSGYVLDQSVTIDGKDIAKVEAISREVTELIESGIELNSRRPKYYYSQLQNLKLDLLAKAAADAKNRASTIAKNSGGGLGKLKNAGMGVFQIIGKNSDEDYSYGGAFNTSSKEKTATITVKAEYDTN